MTNTFAGRYPITIYGASHAEEIGIVIEGLPSTFEISEEEFLPDLSRRKSGAKGTTPRIEADLPNIRSREPLEVFFRNENRRSTDYSLFEKQPRPGHSDYTSMIKYGQTFPGGGFFSGRMTIALVAAGTVFKKLLGSTTFEAKILEIGGEKNWEEKLQQAIKEGDSLGGIVECRISNVPKGLGEPFFDSVEAVISHLVFSIPGVRGIEFGDGFQASRMRGSEHNDLIINAEGKTATNGAGGINGGITNGNDIVFRVAFKPTSSIAKPQETFNFETGKVEPLRCPGRHDACFVLRTPVIVESVAAIALAQLL